VEEKLELLQQNPSGKFTTRYILQNWRCWEGDIIYKIVGNWCFILDIYETDDEVEEDEEECPICTDPLHDNLHR
jgi:hypothetical protein